MADLIDEHREAILHRWTDEVRRKLGAKGTTQVELEDHIPQFLKQMGQALRRPPTGPLADVTRDPPLGGHAVAQEHGRQRFRLGFNVESVVYEYVLLREVIYDFIPLVGASPGFSEIRLVSDFISAGIAEGVAAHARQNETQANALAEELRTSGERLRRVLEASRTAIWDIDLENGALVADTKLLEFLYIDGPPVLTLDAAMAALDERDRDAVWSAINRARSGADDGRCFARFRTGGVGKNPLRWLESSGQVHFNGDGKAVRFVGTTQDITERQRREEFEKHLLGIVSHDLRGPLNAIKLGAAALTRFEDIDDAAAAIAIRINAAADRATKMVADLLDFTQARVGGGLVVSRSRVDLRDVVQDVLEEVAIEHPTRRVIASPVGNIEGNWDAPRLAQVVQNLVINAIKYSPPDTAVTLAMTLAQDENDTAFAKLTVQNFGEPIASGQLARLFEPMQRATELIDRAGRSVGLGLYIVKSIVEAHGGTVAVRSTAKDGTTVEVHLPVA